MSHDGLIRHYHGCEIRSAPLAEFVANTDGWCHLVFCGDQKIGEGRTLAEAIDIARCSEDAREELKTLNEEQE